MARKINRKLTDVFKYIKNLGVEGVCWEYTGPYNEKRRMPEFYFKGDKLAPYRVVWELINGPIEPPELIILHSCDNRICCNTAHMRLGSREENNAEAEERERHGLPHTIVRSIRRLIAEGKSHQSIADVYGIARTTVTAIANNRTHKRTSDEEDGEN